MSVDSTIVLDLGSSTVKAGYVFGFPSDDEPRVVTPAAVRLLPDGGQQQQGAAATPPTTDAHEPAGSGGGTLLYPVQQGVVQDWDALETLLHYVLYDELGWVVGEEGFLMLGDPVMTSRTHRERMMQLAFEVFNVQGYFVADQAVLSLYAVGKLNGTVVDLGERTTCVAPVLDGLTQLSACQRLPYGGSNLSAYFRQLLAARGVVLPPGEAAAEAAKLALLQGLSAAATAAAAAGAAGGGEEGQAAAEAPITHTLPDGQVITMRPKEDGESLLAATLNPSLMGLQLPPLGEVVVTAAASHGERDVRKMLLENIFVCGGGSGTPGLSRQLLADVRSVAPPPLQPGLCGVPEYMPAHTAKVAAWMGGAVLAKVVFGGGQQVTKADYEERGPLVVHAKCS